eukprot:11403941-Ditylum_brightwellii.AAC.1
MNPFPNNLHNTCGTEIYYTSGMTDGNIVNGEFAQIPTDENERQNVEYKEEIELYLNEADIDVDDDVDDWSERYDEKYETWLVDCAKKFYLEQNNALHDNSEVKLFKEDIYRPKNYRGKAQKLIVGSHLLQHKKWMEY